jgi:hypothetical protein
MDHDKPLSPNGKYVEVEFKTNYKEEPVRIDIKASGLFQRDWRS